MAPSRRAAHPHRLRHVPLFYIRPSQDLGLMAGQEFYRLPRVLRYLLRGIGASERTGWDLLSYLSFDAGYTVPLMELGYRDGKAQAKDLEMFLNGA
jgi:NTE family protein